MNHMDATQIPISALSPSRLVRPLHAFKTILVVEDESFVRQMIYDTLGTAGYRVLQCGDAQQAKALFQQYGDIVDLVIADVVLPGENGRDLAKDLLDLDSELKVILISGYAVNLKPVAGTERNRVFGLPKPFSSESLLRKIWQAMSSIVGEVAS